MGSWFSVKEASWEGSGQGSQLFKTHNFIADITTWAQERFVCSVCSNWPHDDSLQSLTNVVYSFPVRITLLQSRFLWMFSIVYIHVCQLEVFFLAAFAGPLRHFLTQHHRQLLSSRRVRSWWHGSALCQPIVHVHLCVIQTTWGSSLKNAAGGRKTPQGTFNFQTYSYIIF